MAEAAVVVAAEEVAEVMMIEAMTIATMTIVTQDEAAVEEMADIKKYHEKIKSCYLIYLIFYIIKIECLNFWNAEFQ